MAGLLEYTKNGQVTEPPLYRFMRGNVQSFLNSIPDPSKMTPEEQLSLGLNANPVMGLLGTTAYHGSPYLFDKFDLNKVGTGQGAQAYGHGIYFAENPTVAKGYANELGKEITINNNPLLSMGKRPSMSTNVSGNSFLDDFLVANLGDVKATRKDILDSVKVMKEAGNETAVKEYQGLLSDLRKVRDNVEIKNLGNFYKVDIPDQDIPKLLNWDVPIKDQPEMYNLIKNNIKDADIRKSFENNAESGITGANAYSNYLSGKTNAEKSKNALDIGIKGIKYLDQGSRQAGGTNNFVVFDPSQVKILERNNKGLLK